MRAYDKKYLGDELFNQKPEIIVITLNLPEFVKNLKFKTINPSEISKKYEFVFKKSNLYVYQLLYQ